MDTAMIDPRAQLRLQTWLSPAFPTGAFSYSHGLEAATATATVSSKEDLHHWLVDLLTSGPGWNDAVLLKESYGLAAAKNDLAELSELASAMSFSGERHLETTRQGGAFLAAASAWITIAGLPDDTPLPVSVGAVSGALDINLESTLTVYLHAYISNQIQAALRLMRLGQQEGVELLASLEDVILKTADRALTSSLDDLGSNTVMADIIAIQHENLNSRIFRS